MSGCSHPENIEPDLLLEAAVQVLREHQHRVTVPRRAILSVLVREHGPFTADEIHRRVGGEVCDLVTVYRCLGAMEEIGLVRRCDFGDGSYRYEVSVGGEHHHHIICRSCHSVETLDRCMAEELERLARRMGYVAVSHTLEVFGVCTKCQQTASQDGPATRSGVVVERLPGGCCPPPKQRSR